MFQSWLDRGVNPMYIYNFSIRQGWYSLLYRYLDKINTHCQETKNFIKITDIKEKFGSLDISYYDGDVIDAQIMKELYDESMTVCEFCSKPNAKRTSMKKDGWIYTICDSCYKNKFHVR